MPPVRHGLLAFLAQGPRYGYQLRGEFGPTPPAPGPSTSGGSTTLDCLARDGLAAAAGQDGEGHQLYAITDAGRNEVQAWFTTPVRREQRPRDELAIKLALTVVTGGVDVAAVIQTQRTDTLRALQEYTKLLAAAADEDLARLVRHRDTPTPPCHKTPPCHRRGTRHHRCPAPVGHPLPDAHIWQFSPPGRTPRGTLASSRAPGHPAGPRRDVPSHPGG